MSKYEDRAFRVGKAKLSTNELKGQLLRLKGDLEQIRARKPNAAVVAPLQQRIRELEAQIAEADASTKRDQEREAARRAGGDEADDRAAGRTSARSTAGRFPPRGRPGQG